MTVDAVEKKITEIYSTAEKDISQKWSDWVAKIEPEVKSLKQAADSETDPAQKAALEKKYKAKLTSYIAGNEHYLAMSNEVSSRLVNVQKQAVEWVNDQLPQHYVMTYNQTGTGVAKSVKGYSFELADQATIKNLAMNEDASLLPYQTLDNSAAAKYYRKVINSQVTQAVVQGESVDKLAKRVANVTHSGVVAATRTARTTLTSAENKGRLDAQHKAQDDGIIVKKRWNSAAWSDRTRDWHADLDGVEVDIDEPFHNDYGDIDYPGDPHAHPANVYNCRCTLETVVKGFKNLQTGDVYNLDGSVDYASVNSQPVNSQATTAPAPTATAQNVISVDDFPDAMKTKTEKKNAQALVDYINAHPDANPDVVEAYSQLNDKMNISNFKISHGANNALTTSYYASSGKIAEVKLNVPKLAGKTDGWEFETTLHEYGHLIDFVNRDDASRVGYATENIKELQAIFAKVDKTIGPDVTDLFTRWKTEADAVVKTLKNDAQAKIYALADDYKNGSLSYIDYLKATQKVNKKLSDDEDAGRRNALGGGVTNLQDIYDALSGGSARDSGVVDYGHGSCYYAKHGKKEEETLANYFSLSIAHPELIDMLRNDKPDLVDALEKTVSTIIAKGTVI